MSEISKRKNYTESRIKALKSKLLNCNSLLDGKACVYATGSFGRLEAGPKSDLDLFIVGKSDPSRIRKDGIKESQLSRLDEICIKAELIEATRSLNFPDFDGDGKYLVHYPVDEFTKSIGQPDDDARNTLTGRLLLFLESKPLLGEAVYDKIIEEVIAVYWRDYPGHFSNFSPAFLTNDILRLWRTFCVNYEARTSREPDEKKLEGKVKNYKLKHSRMLTCYSALLYLLVVYKKHNSVSPTDAINMTKLTPIDRLLWIKDEFKDAKLDIENLLEQYELFLERTKDGDRTLADNFKDSANSSQFILESYKFGDLMQKALETIGKDNHLYRLIIV
ncbi:nucleotidyltransferase domain-containing protein [Novispirillum itersonii]|uniref:Putative nucleotidyltransferase n=1 Tax=Novispirillum itersonii TaxID=189 RepID=A0A7W9ZHN1_NOVIT|nr:nucleotidyltransferase domain-containing protein [Novispirillum itersonii]MBB6211630.1 putative nucleotidyltransferase [Novispirillum itersonii]